LPQPAVPALSLEGLLALDPDIIIDIFPEPDDHNDAIDHIRQQWQTLSQLSAVQNNQVHIIEEDYATVPGPRIYLILQRFAQIIHPEINWQNHAQN
jgi:iron complex transport system substrate-binding protein